MKMQMMRGQALGKVLLLGGLGFDEIDDHNKRCEWGAEGNHTRLVQSDAEFAL
jgi:hypothetical protein